MNVGTHMAVFNSYYIKCLSLYCLESSQNVTYTYAEENNLSPFDLKIDCLCQNIKINSALSFWLSNVPLISFV